MAHDLADGSGSMSYRRCGRSGVLLSPLSLGLWHNFGHDRRLETQRAILRRAVDLGLTHVDLANNYGPPPGAAEENFGRLLATDFRGRRDDLFISTKAGWRMWPGPYGDGGSRKHLLSSLEQSLRRMGLDHVDVFYSHRPDPGTPIEETMGALDSAVRQGKALYAGISAYSPAEAREAVAVLERLGTPLLVHQPRYSLLDRTPEDGLLDTVAAAGAGAVVFSPLAQGLLTDRYLHGVPPGSRADQGVFLTADDLTDELLGRLRQLRELAAARGQTLAQMALAWVLRDPRVTSAIIGASSVEQLEGNVGALRNLEFDADELAHIDRLAPPGRCP